LRYGADGLLPVVLQDHESLEVLIVAYMNAEAVELTHQTGLVHLWSRSRRELWLKGETSGRLQRVVEMRPNCELDSLLVLVRQELPGACHTGHSSCYYRRVLPGGELEETAPPVFDPEDVYGEDLRGLLERLLGAYAWLREQPPVSESGTSLLLHGQGPDTLARLREEWDELLGVLDGTHVHSGFEDDALLELYQTLYWTCLYQLLRGDGGAGSAHARVLDGYGAGGDPREAVAEALAADDRERPGLLWHAWGVGCRAAGVRPSVAVRRDLDELRARPYMEEYFAAGGGPGT
jgi:phosphoribosyl-AMP cyclohydrolase